VRPRSALPESLRDDKKILTTPKNQSQNPRFTKLMSLQEGELESQKKLLRAVLIEINSVYKSNV
jgi:hypothetical protein